MAGPVGKVAGIKSPRIFTMPRISRPVKTGPALITGSIRSPQRPNPLLVATVNPNAVALRQLSLPTAQLVRELRSPEVLSLPELKAGENMQARLDLLLDPTTALDAAALTELPATLAYLADMPAYQAQVAALIDKAYLLPESAFVLGEVGEITGQPALSAVTLIGGREQNEDGLLVMVDPQGRQYHLVADGMGGHGDGEVASKMAIQLVYGYLANAPELTPEVIEQALAFANTVIFNSFLKTNRHPGTTMVGAIVDGDRVYTWGIGDSAIYGIAADGSIRMLNKPNSLLVEYEELSGFQLSLPIAGPKLKELEERLKQSIVKAHANVITAAVGIQAQVKKLSVQEITLLPGEMLILASDGLTGALGDHPSIKLNELRQAHQTPAALGAALKELAEKYAQEHPKTDNATFILVDPAKVIEITAAEAAPVPAEPAAVDKTVDKGFKKDPAKLLAKPKQSLGRRVLTALAGVTTWGGVTVALSLQTWSSLFADLTQLSHLSNLELFATTNALVGGGLLVLTGLGYLAARAVKGLYLYLSDTGATRQIFSASPAALYLDEGYRPETVRQLLPGQKEYLALTRSAVAMVLNGSREDRADAVRNGRLNGAILADLAAYYDGGDEVNVNKLRSAAKGLRQEGLISEAELLLVTFDPSLVTDRQSAARELQPLLSYPIASVRRRAQAALSLLNEGPVVDRRNYVLQSLSLDRSPQDQLQALRVLVALVNKKELAPQQIEEAKERVQALHEKYEEMSAELQEALLAAAKALDLTLFTEVGADELLQEGAAEVEIVDHLDPSTSTPPPIPPEALAEEEIEAPGSVTAEIRALQQELDNVSTGVAAEVTPGSGAVRAEVITVKPEVGHVAAGAAGVLPSKPADAARPEATDTEAIAAVSEVERIAQMLQDANQRMNEINDLLKDEERVAGLANEVFGELQQEVAAIATQIADLLLDIDNADQLVNGNRKLKRDITVFNSLRSQVLAELIRISEGTIKWQE